MIHFDKSLLCTHTHTRTHPLLNTHTHTHTHTHLDRGRQKRSESASDEEIDKSESKRKRKEKASPPRKTHQHEGRLISVQQFSRKIRNVLNVAMGYRLVSYELPGDSPD